MVGFSDMVRSAAIFDTQTRKAELYTFVIPVPEVSDHYAFSINGVISRSGECTVRIDNLLISFVLLPLCVLKESILAVSKQPDQSLNVRFI